MATRGLARAYAHFDLSDQAGWKQQLDAAERLATAGVLPANQLLGLYTERKAAASGGIWDRVSAVQRLDRALGTNDPTELDRALTRLWDQIKGSGVETVVAEIFAARLHQRGLTEGREKIGARLLYLSTFYEEVALSNAAPDGLRFLASVAKGAPAPDMATTPLERTIARALGGKVSPSADIQTVRTTTLGMALLARLDALSVGGDGALQNLAQALADLRALGLEDMVRRTALQVLILRDDT